MQFNGAIVELEIEGNTLLVSGEVDINTAPAVEEALLELIRSTNGRPVVDMSEVTYFDSSGIQALLRARDAMDDNREPIQIVGLSQHTDRIFRLVGLERLFEIEQLGALRPD